MSYLRHMIFFIFVLSISTVILAGKNLTPFNDEAYTIGLDLGIGHPTNLGKSSQFQLGYSTFIYSPIRNNLHPFYGGLSLDKSVIANGMYLVQMGLSYHYVSNMRVDGNLSQGITPPFYQANYAYAVESSQVLVEAIFRKGWYKGFSPYFILGLGAAFNRTENFSTTVPPYLTLTPSYPDKAISSFSYAVGMGCDFLIDPKLSLGINYRFTDLGAFALGSGKIRYRKVSNTFRQSNLYLNTLVVHLNYFI